MLLHGRQTNLAQIAIAIAIAGLHSHIIIRLSWLLLDARNYIEGTQLVAEIISDLKKVDEKVLLVEAFLLESKFHSAVMNTKRAKASLTACRTSANQIHIKPSLQCDIEYMAGVIAAKEQEYNVAHSFFLEAFDGYDAINEKDLATR